MKRTILLAAIVLLVSAATAVVGGPEPDDGEMAITSAGSTASGSTAVGPNGTEWSSTVEMSGRNPDTGIGETVENISFSENETTFSGYVQAPTPCHVLDQETEKLDDESYRMNIQTVQENQSQICAQQVVMIEYNGSFEAETPYTLEVQHNNQTVDNLENSDEGESTGEQSGGILSSFFGWLGNLF